MQMQRMGTNEINNDRLCINDVLTDDGLRAILGKLEGVDEKNNYGLVCKRWLFLQSTERRRLCARAGPHMLQRLADRFTRVVDLDFSQSVSRSFYPGVSDKDLHIIATRFQCIRSLNVHECKGITDAGLTAVGKGGHNLHSLDISQCKNITDEGVRALAEGCQNLSTLRLDGCKRITDESLQALASKCKKLEKLGLQSCNSITDDGLSALAQGCRSIQVLEMSGCVNAGDTGVIKIAESCSLLKVLNLSDCLKIGNTAVMSLAERCKSLEVLMIGGCKLVSDEAIQTLTSSCGPSLRILQLERCLNISNVSVLSVFSLCPQLENLNIACCDKVTDHAFSYLGNGGCGSHLEDLRISNCPGISVAGIALVANFCNSLQRLDVRSCALITEESVNGAGIHYVGRFKLIF